MLIIIKKEILPKTIDKGRDGEGSLDDYLQNDNSRNDKLMPPIRNLCMAPLTGPHALTITIYTTHQSVEDRAG